MKQQINLFLEEFRVQKDPLTAVLMGKIIGGVLGIMLMLSSYDLLVRWSLGNELSEIREVLVVETRKTNEIDELLARRSENTVLSNRLEQAEIRLVASQEIRDFLSETQLGNLNGFSEYFKDLSRASMNGLSITNFTFSNGGGNAQLVGHVLDSATVPRYVDNIELGNSPLSKHQFSPSISRAEQGAPYFNFILSSSNE